MFRSLPRAAWDASLQGPRGWRPRHLAISPARRATVLGMTALKQLAFSLAFAIAAVAAAQYIMWTLNGQP
jgi:hypothetical protein